MNITRSNWQGCMPELTKKLLREHYSRNFEYVLSCMSDDIVWVGPLEGQYSVGKKKFTELLTPEQDTMMTVSEDEYFIAWQDSSTCTVVGKLTVAISSPADSKLLLMCRQRFTIQWIWQDGPRVIHIHGSNPWEFTDQGEPFPYRVARETYEYIRQFHSSDYRTVSLKTVDNKTIFVAEEKIIYIEAQGSHCVIHHMEGTVTVNYKISEIAQMFSRQIYQIHRSYLVNIHYVLGISRYQIIMYGNTMLPIPEKRYRQVKQEIAQFQREDAG